MLKSIIPLSIATSFSRLSGFVRDYVLAQMFLTGPLLDLFFVLFRFPQYTRRFFAEGSLSQALSPELGQAFEHRQTEKARALYAQTFWFIMIALGSFCASVFLFPRLWAVLLAPGFEAAQQDLLVRYLPLAASYAIALSLISLYALVLQLHDSYWLNGLSPLFLNLAIIISALFFKSNALFYLVSFMVGAGFLQVLLQAWQAKPYLGAMIPPWPRWTTDFYQILKSFLHLSPLALIILFNTLFDQYFLSFSDPGEMSLYYISERIIDLPVGILGYSIYSVFAGYYMRQFQDRAKSAHLESRALFFVLLFVLPAVGAITLLAPQIMRLFVSAASQQSYAAILLRLFSLNIIPIVLNKVFVIILNARHQRHHIVQTHFYGMLMNALLDMTLFQVLQGAGIALSTTLTLLLQLLIFERRYPLLWPQLQQVRLAHLIRPIVCIVGSLLALFYGFNYIATYQLSPWANIICVGGWSLVVGGLYLITIWPMINQAEIS